MKFIILGAGLSGLTCGVVLKKNGHDVTIIEKESQVGGLARTHSVGGYTFDYGPHFLFGEKVFELIRKDFPDIELKRLESTREKMFFRNKYFNFPFDPKNILKGMEKTKVPGVVLDLMLKSLSGNDKSGNLQNIEEWVIQAVGKRIYDYISLGGYIKKLYGLPPTDISYEWGVQKLKFLSKWRDAGLIKLTMKSLTEEKNVKKRVIHYPLTGGISHIPVKIHETFRALGGEVIPDSEVFLVRHEDEGVSVIFGKDGKEQNIRGDFLVSTIPITKLIGMLSPAPPTEIMDTAKMLRYRNLILLSLFIKKDSLLKDQCIYFTEDEIFFRRITEFRHLDRSMSPKGRTSLCIEITCFDNDDIYRKDLQYISEIVVEQLERMGYIRKGDVEGSHLLRIPYAYPVYEMSTHNKLDQTLDCLESYDRMISIGRQGLFFYNAMNSSIMMSTELGHKLSSMNESGRKEIIRQTYQARKVKYRN